MAKGKVASYTEKEGRNGKYYTVSMNEQGTTKSYLAKDPATVAAVLLSNKDGSEIEYTASPSQDGSATWMRVAGSQQGGGRGGFGGGASRSSNESFAASYAKDVVIALVNNGKIEPNQIDAALDKFFTKFMALIKTS